MSTAVPHPPIPLYPPFLRVGDEQNTEKNEKENADEDAYPPPAEVSNVSRGARAGEFHPEVSKELASP